jgi:hypothetical protein
MSPREILYYIFYTLCFLLAIIAGVTMGFTGTHTPPAPFVIELFTLPIGFILFVIDLIMHNSTKVHKIGLSANGLIVAYIMILYFT